ncbi:MAG: hypothetical protein WC979_02805 [Candidatus Pacearchaeota archaeon]|jgi:hypothetical protein|nr:hypothetical protein [Clostridia bacterium]
MKNTKLIFYCTYCENASFYKAVFETVIEDTTFDSIYEARNWVDDQIPSLCREFDFQLVFEWVVLSFKKTNAKPYDTILSVPVIEGRLVFAKKRKKATRKPKVAKTEGTKELKKIEEVSIEVVRRTYKSCWIEPSGHVHWVGFACHEEFAADYLKDNCPELCDKYGFVEKQFGKYHYEILQDMGWARILGWTDPPNFVLPDKMSAAQKRSVREYCMSENVDYAAWPEILKS